MVFSCVTLAIPAPKSKTPLHCNLIFGSNMYASFIWEWDVILIKSWVLDSVRVTTNHSSRKVSVYRNLIHLQNVHCKLKHFLLHYLFVFLMVEKASSYLLCIAAALPNINLGFKTQNFFWLKLNFVFAKFQGDFSRYSPKSKCWITKLVSCLSRNGESLFSLTP